MKTRPVQPIETGRDQAADDPVRPGLTAGFPRDGGRDHWSSCLLSPTEMSHITYPDHAPFDRRFGPTRGKIDPLQDRSPVMTPRRASPSPPAGTTTVDSCRSYAVAAPTRASIVDGRGRCVANHAPHAPPPAKHTPNAASTRAARLHGRRAPRASMLAAWIPSTAAPAIRSVGVGRSKVTRAWPTWRAPRDANHRRSGAAHGGRPHQSSRRSGRGQFERAQQGPQRCECGGGEGWTHWSLLRVASGADREAATSQAAEGRQGGGGGGGGCHGPVVV